jgi:hypothetical protein
LRRFCNGDAGSDGCGAATFAPEAFKRGAAAANGAPAHKQPGHNHERREISAGPGHSQGNGSFWRRVRGPRFLLLANRSIQRSTPVSGKQSVYAEERADCACRSGCVGPSSRGVFDRNGFAVVPHHFYTPIVMPADLNRPLDESRRLPGLDLNEQGQLDLIAQFKYADELRCIPMEKASETTYGYRNDR